MKTIADLEKFIKLNDFVKEATIASETLQKLKFENVEEAKQLLIKGSVIFLLENFRRKSYQQSQILTSSLP